MKGDIIIIMLYNYNSKLSNLQTNLGHSTSNISMCSSADNLDFDSNSLKKKKRSKYYGMDWFLPTST